MTSETDAGDGSGDLSIIMQGALWGGDLERVALYCRHWRTLFPQAEIIVAVSITDVLRQRSDGSAIPRNAALRGAWSLAALKILSSDCDKVTFGAPALPMPPIKNDSGATNNINLQIEAARAGLAAATRRYCLRVRNDLIFQSTDFVRFYTVNHNVGRRQSPCLEQRIMISPLFTINPFTLERLPYHFSDWFHYGLTSDIREIWNTPQFSLGDAVHYRLWPHPPHSNDIERTFNTRIGVEQHLIRNFLLRSGRAAPLAMHNDLTAAEDSMRVLVDDFLICDVGECPMYFEKYTSHFASEDARNLCIHHDDWLRAVSCVGDFAPLFLSRTRWAYRRLKIEDQLEAQIPTDLPVLSRHSFFNKSDAAASRAPGQLHAGEELLVGGGLYSPSGACALLFEPGSLVAVGDPDGVAERRWSLGLGAGAIRLLMQPSGALAALDAANRAVWESPTSGRPNALYLEFGDDGGLQITDGVDVAWRFDVDGPELPRKSRLAPGETLRAGGELSSSDGAFRLSLEDDGLHLRTRDGFQVCVIDCAGANRLSMQADGNLVVYSEVGRPLWASGSSWPSGRASLHLVDDGSLEVRDSDALVWRGPPGGTS